MTEFPDLDPNILARAAKAHRDNAAGRGNGQTPPYRWQDHAFTAAELRQRTFPPIAYVVPGLLPEGLSILAGRPKVGKSWWALDIALAVAGGCLGDRICETGDVLYAAMEDNPRRLQRRIDRLASPFSAWPERLTLTTSWRRLDQGGVTDLAEWADRVAQPRLAIFDTLAGVKPVRTRQGYETDYEALAALHRLTKRCRQKAPIFGRNSAFLGLRPVH